MAAMKRLATLFLACLLPATASGFCFEEAGNEYGVSPLLLWGIARHESGMNPAAVGRNGNGTYDYGLMQINSRWAKVLGIDITPPTSLQYVRECRLYVEICVRKAPI